MTEKIAALAPTPIARLVIPAATKTKSAADRFRRLPHQHIDWPFPTINAFRQLSAADPWRLEMLPAFQVDSLHISRVSA